MSMIGRPAVLLDRDGTIIVERHYIGDPADVILEDCAAEGLGMLTRLSMPLVVVSNQSGVGRGFFDEEQLRRVNARAAELLEAEGVHIDGWYSCPHLPEDRCHCRKPLAGMAIQAAHDLNLDLTRSWVIGDKRADLELAVAIGATGILVLTGHGQDNQDWAQRTGALICADLAAAAAIITARAVAGVTP